MQSSLDQVRSKPLQSVCIGGPAGVGAGGNAAVVVQIYALGAGVSLVGQSLDLPPTEPAFELEANGQVFVFDPLRACHANWLVSTVKGHIRAVLEPLQAVDQEGVTEIGNGLFQGNLPSKTTILYLPAGYGKTTMAEALAQRLGCDGVVDEWHLGRFITAGALHLTNVDVLASSTHAGKE